MEHDHLINNHNNNVNVNEEKSEPNDGAKRSIAERRGFNSNAAQINTGLFHTATSTTPSPPPRLTIPPGISPTALLDSPIMLPNSQVSLYIYYTPSHKKRFFIGICVMFLIKIRVSLQ